MVNFFTFAKSNEVKGVFKSFKNQVSMANIVKKELDTRTFPEICASLSNAEWLAIRDRCVIQTGKTESAVYYWREGKQPVSLMERKAVSEIVNRVLGIKTNHRTLFPL
jgi:hypothetical protein